MPGLSLSLTWVARTPNKKTGDIPTAYVGATVKECRSSCEGCALLDEECYAWHGFAAMSLARIEERKILKPGDYTLENALSRRHTDARVARIGAMGDPARADPETILEARRQIIEDGLDGVLSYTHFWREPWAQHLKDLCLASCEFIEDAQLALDMGWTPALLLPWDYNLDDGAKLFDLPDGSKGLICPAQTKEDVTCNDCRLCWLQHPVWKGQKIVAIGFLDHSRKALREKRRWQKGKQLPIFEKRPVLARKRTI